MAAGVIDCRRSREPYHCGQGGNLTREMNESKAPVIQDVAFEWKAVRASGPGGQNVNKVASKVELRVDLDRIQGLDDASRHRLARLAGARFDSEGRLLVTSQLSRDQGRNLEDAKAKAIALIERSTFVPRARRPTRPGKAAKARRLDAKKKDARRKAVRRLRNFDD